jgi:predicted negative regulator of RcsB-dependent stress response
VEVYTSEHDQVEALRRWWNKNGRSVVIGVALALIGIFGWQAWQRQQAATAAAAAADYEALLSAVGSDEEKAAEIGSGIVSQFPDTVYADLSNMTLAAAAVDKGDLDGAEAHLRWVVQNGHEANLKALAKLRLARVELSRGNAEAALKLVDGLEAAGLDGYLLETKGDILAALNKPAEARDAYAQALEQYSEVPSKQPLVTMKLNDLAARDESR